MPLPAIPGSQKSSMAAKYAPVALFAYDRPFHVRRTIEALQNNYLAPASQLFVFSDASKSDDSAESVRQVRHYLGSIRGFQSVQVIERARNLGLAGSIIDGVTRIVTDYGRVIVLEDDLVTSPFFLTYMNDALDYYSDADPVISIHSYVYPVPGELPDYFFLRGADCWGWATWKRGWDLFEPDGARLLSALRNQRLTGDFDRYYATSLTQMLIDQIAGRNNSWAIRWMASAYLNEKLTLYPGRSFVQNIGLDQTGTHCGTSRDFQVHLREEYETPSDFPVPQESKLALNKIQHYYATIRPSIFRRAVRRLITLLGI